MSLTRNKPQIDMNKLNEIMKKLKNINIDTEICGDCLEDLNINLDDGISTGKIKGWKGSKSKK